MKSSSKSDELLLVLPLLVDSDSVAAGGAEELKTHKISKKNLSLIKK